MKQINAKKSVIYVFVAGIAIALIIVAVLLFKPKTTYVEGGEEIYTIDLLDCRISEHEGAFFNSKIADEALHEIRVTFRENKIDKIYYEYKTSFSSEEVAKSQNAEMHANYNIYMGNKGIEPGKLDPRFSTIDNETTVSLIAEKGDLALSNVSLFFLDANDFQKINSRSIEEMKKLYEGKGFKCVIQK